MQNALKRSITAKYEFAPPLDVVVTKVGRGGVLFCYEELKTSSKTVQDYTKSLMSRQTPAKKKNSSLISLYPWYEKNKRELPFRKTRLAYEIWVSEIMLQQTRVAAMLGLYEKFLQSFPDVETLAKAPLEKVLVAWQGLGYYSRARNLHKGAKDLMEKHKGCFPKDLKAALAIPGVGPYTAAAVLSISYDQPLALLDGNVTRVLARLYHIPKPSSAFLKERAQALMEGRGKIKAGKHNQAMMELGSLLCTPKIPKCPQCPLAKACLSYRKGGSRKVNQIPIPKKEEFVELDLKLWLILSQDQKSILILKEKHSRFFKDLWFLPYAYKAKSPIVPRAAPHFPIIISKLPLGKVQKFSQSIQHSITHHKIKAKLEALYIECRKEELLEFLKSPHDNRKGRETQWLWVQCTQAREYLINSLSHKALQTFAKHADYNSG